MERGTSRGEAIAGSEGHVRNSLFDKQIGFRGESPLGRGVAVVGNTLATPYEAQTTDPSYE